MKPFLGQQEKPESLVKQEVIDMSIRKFSRVQFNVGATIKIADRQFQGAVENLSMTGMFLITSEQLTEGDRAEITIVLSGILPEISVGFNGIVTRITEDGVGFTFDKMDLDTYVHLKNIIAYNIDDAEKVLEEISHSIDEKLASE